MTLYYMVVCLIYLYNPVLQGYLSHLGYMIAKIYISYKPVLQVYISFRVYNTPGYPGLYKYIYILLGIYINTLISGSYKYIYILLAGISGYPGHINLLLGIYKYIYIFPTINLYCWEYIIYKYINYI